jgi:hypothetical protein
VIVNMHGRTTIKITTRYTFRVSYIPVLPGIVGNINSNKWYPEDCREGRNIEEAQ